MLPTQNLRNKKIQQLTVTKVTSQLCTKVTTLSRSAFPAPIHQEAQPLIVSCSGQMRSLITLTTDFGTTDHYVGTMKGVIARIGPEAQVTDITHAITPFSVLGRPLPIAASPPHWPY